MTVWAVSRGAYSDYFVRVVCATKEIAQAYADGMNVGRKSEWDMYEVEEFPYLDSVPEFVDVLTITQWVEKWSNRKPTLSMRRDVKQHEDRCEAIVTEHPDSIYITVSGWDHARVHKAHTERTAHARAALDLRNTKETA